MTHKELKEYTSKKWVEIKDMEQLYQETINDIQELEGKLSACSFQCQKKLDDIERAHNKHNKAM